MGGSFFVHGLRFLPPENVWREIIMKLNKNFGSQRAARKIRAPGGSHTYMCYLKKILMNEGKTRMKKNKSAQKERSDYGHP